jgi:hypothetical protein
MGLAFPALAHAKDALNCEEMWLTLHVETDFVSREKLAMTLRNHDYKISGRTEARYEERFFAKTGVSTSDILSAEVLSHGLLITDRDFYGGTGFWFLIGRRNPETGLREHFRVAIFLDEVNDSFKIIDVRPASGRDVSIYFQGIQALGDAMGPPLEYRIAKINGISNLKIPQYVLEKVKGRHQVELQNIMDAFKAGKRISFRPYLDRGVVISDQFVHISRDDQGRKLVIGLKQVEGVHGKAWRLATAYYE